MKIGVYGLGRFGYFWAELLSGKFDVSAYNRSVDKPCPKNVKRCSRDELLNCDVIYLCVSISSFELVLKSLARDIKPGTLIVDTCSVKTYPLSVMEKLLRPDISYLATHPMFGPDSGKNGVTGLPMVFCSGRCAEAVQQKWINVFRDFDLNIIEMSAEQHDREASFTQGITHFVGRVLGELELHSSEIGTVGYRSLLEIIEQTCNDPMQLFYDLQRYNPFTHDMRMQLKHSIDDTMHKLAEADIGEADL
ncbi:MAG: prephenate dehydrogenase/arogenate dehydrogenase family protein [Bacteroidetes bacterium]|nr:prephenate dehydrogenase/arogenate dehydrogenase family protein [Bacteroidota bacterium]